MNWEAIGAIGELVGAIAVVVSLIYLAAQIRHNTRQVDELSRSQRQVTLNEVASRFTNFRRMLTESREVATIWLSGQSDLGELDPPARVQFDFLVVEMFWAYAMLFVYRQQEAIDATVVDLTLENLPLYVSARGIEQWWCSSPHKNEYPIEFISLVDHFYASRNAGEAPAP